MGSEDRKSTNRLLMTGYTKFSVGYLDPWSKFTDCDTNHKMAHCKVKTQVKWRQRYGVVITRGVDAKGAVALQIRGMLLHRLGVVNKEQVTP